MVRNGILLLPVAAFLFSTPAMAASFDCGNPSSIIEKTICGDPALSAADEKLTARYKSALAALPGMGRKQLRDGQRSWLRYVQTICTDNPSPFMAPYQSLEVRRSNCLTQEYGQRQKQLDAAVFKAGGLVISRVDQFSVLPATDQTGPDTGFVVKQVSYPQIDRPANAKQRAWNAFIEKLAGDPAKGNQENDMTDISVDYRIAMPVSDILSVTLDSYSFGHGAAHGYSSRLIYNWLLGEGRLLTPEDLFDGAKDWRAAVDQMAFDLLMADNAKEDKGYTVQSPDQIKALVEDPLRWTLEANGLGVQFNIYEVGPYVVGAPKIVIPWEKLKPYLVSGAPVPAHMQ